jgi:hypothetical protein
MDKSLVHRHVGRRRAADVAAVDAGTATFDQWFSAQFGAAPRVDLAEARQRLHDLENQVNALRLALEAAEQRETQRDAALKAWQAREDLIRRNLKLQEQG